jgi:hypothetical protein
MLKKDDIKVGLRVKNTLSGSVGTIVKTYTDKGFRFDTKWDSCSVAVSYISVGFNYRDFSNFRIMTKLEDILE